MYSPLIVAKRLDLIEQKAKFRPSPIPKQQIFEFVDWLRENTSEEGKLSKKLSPEQLKLINNERLMCRVDFRYWAERYGTILKDGVEGGGVGRIRFWASQEALLKIISEAEERNYELHSKGFPVDGIRIAYHKARQLGATMVWRLLKMHRLTTHPHHRAMAASVDEDKIMELYDRDKLILESLPFYLRPEVGFDVKGEHIYFSKLNSRVLYQQASQKSGLGQGRQFELAHLTECASWPYPRMIEFDFFPTLPLGPNTLCGLESTANGRGNWWHEWSEDVRKGNRRGWRYCFTPWYIEDKKYRAQYPEGWIPSSSTLEHAKKVYETSREFTGRDVLLAKEQLYWYETERAAAQRGGSLNLFLSNYCATPEESFQHTIRAQFDVETMEKVRFTTRKPICYEVA